MSLRIIEISAPEKASDKIETLAEQYNAIDCWQSNRKSWLPGKKDERFTSRILVNVDNQQDLLDALQRAVSKEDDWRIILIPVEATIPKTENTDEKPKKENGKPKIMGGSITREELLNDMEAGARLNFDFLLMVFLSAVVAGIGLIESNVAVIIGAMVIAPLLGPNLALAFGTTLGDRDLIFNAIKTNAAGLGLTLLISIIAGLLIPVDSVTTSSELMDRTGVNFAGIILALASGAAAVLSITAGVSSALVGVMVAVALMPPAVALGLMIGEFRFDLAYGAALLLAANIVSVNLAAQTVFYMKGIRPRTWYEEKKSKNAIILHNVIWISALIILCALIWVKTT
ncbi:MAG: TIGR00341 family protein [Pseudomonadota bacterium]